MHASAHRIGTPSCSQVTDPLIRAALTENGTRDTAKKKKALSFVPAMLKLKSSSLVVNTRKNVFILYPQKAAGITYSSAFHPCLIFVVEKQDAETRRGCKCLACSGAPRGAGGV